MNKIKILVSIILALISGSFSGYGLYLQLKEGNPLIAKIVGIGFVLVGIVLSLFVWYAGALMQKEKYQHSGIIFGVIIFLFLLWFAISPPYAALFVGADTALKAEIKDRLQKMYTIYSNELIKINIAQKIKNILNERIIPYLKYQEQIQITQWSGKGPVYRTLYATRKSLEEKKKIFEKELGENEEESVGEDSIEKMKESLESIYDLIKSNDNSLEELQQDFNDYVLNFYESYQTLELQFPATELLNDIIDKLNFVIQKLNYYANSSDNSLIKQAAAYSNQYLKERLQELEKIRQFINTKFPSQKRNITQFNPSFGIIQLTPKLVFKHWLETFSIIVLAYFLDIVFFILSVVPLIIEWKKRAAPKSCQKVLLSQIDLIRNELGKLNKKREEFAELLDKIVDTTKNLKEIH